MLTCTNVRFKWRNVYITYALIEQAFTVRFWESHARGYSSWKQT